MTPVILELIHYSVGPTFSIKIIKSKIQPNKLPPKNASFEWAFEREDGIFEKILNQSFTLPSDGYDIRTSLLFSLNRHLVSHNHHDSTFSVRNGHVSLWETEKSNTFSENKTLIQIFLNPINRGFFFLIRFSQISKLFNSFFLSDSAIAEKALHFLHHLPLSSEL
jgi:hypothetical protein